MTNHAFDFDSPLGRLDYIFNARSVAVVGASANAGKMGHTILKNIIGGGFAGPIYPINPKAPEILGYPCYQTLLDVPGDIDLVVVAVPAHIVPSVLEQAAEKNTHGAIIISGGFREIGNDDLESEMMAIAKKNKIAIIGPNCQGINYTPNKLCASWPLMTSSGVLGIVAQSGTIAAAMGGWAAKEHLGFSCICALGNKSDVNETDMLSFFGNDPKTKVVALNLEGVSDGARFLEIAAQVAKVKPVVVLKPGRTALGAKAAQSHTKSLAGDDRVFDAVCKKTGLIRVNELEEFYDVCKILCLIESMPGCRMQIVTSSGGSGILAADTAVGQGITLPVLDSEIVGALEAVLPSQCVIANPLDLTGDANAQRYEDALTVLAGSDRADGFLVIFGDPVDGAAEVIEKIRHLSDKPIVVAYLGGGETELIETEILQKNGVPVFPTPERAMRAAGYLCKYPRADKVQHHV